MNATGDGRGNGAKCSPPVELEPLLQQVAMLVPNRDLGAEIMSRYFGPWGSREDPDDLEEEVTRLRREESSIIEERGRLVQYLCELTAEATYLFMKLSANHAQVKATAPRLCELQRQLIDIRPRIEREEKKLKRLHEIVAESLQELLIMTCFDNNSAQHTQAQIKHHNDLNDDKKENGTRRSMKHTGRTNLRSRKYRGNKRAVTVLWRAVVASKVHSKESLA